MQVRIEPYEGVVLNKVSSSFCSFFHSLSCFKFDCNFSKNQVLRSFSSVVSIVYGLFRTKVVTGARSKSKISHFPGTETVNN